MKKERLLETANQRLLSLGKKADLVMARGEGMYVYDTEDKEYLDCLAGWAVNSLGHCPKVLADILRDQGQKLINASPGFYNEEQILFADALIQASRFDRVFFCSTGAEANESAIKLARKYGEATGRHHIITTTGSFHGRTLAAMAATGKEAFKKMFHPVMPGFSHVPLNDLAAIESAVQRDTVAIMLELIQGEGGVHESTQEYIDTLRRLCDQHDLLLIIDEVQTGFGRTGKLFAYEHYGLQADIMTLGKGIGGGYPLAAMLCCESINIFQPGEQGGTYTGQPLGMAVGRAVLETILSKNICKNAEAQGEKIKAELATLAQDFPIENIRGKGLLIACDTPKANEIKDAALSHGLLCNACSATTLRFIPALTIEDRHISELFEKLRLAFNSVYSTKEN